MQIRADEIHYLTTRRYDISEVDPVPQWGHDTAAPGPMLTPCIVGVEWSWRSGHFPDHVTTRVRVWGYRTRKDGQRADMPPAEIYASSHQAAWPDWLRELADVNARPEGVPRG